MTNQDIQNQIKKIEAEIKRIDDNENTFYFFIIDSKGCPSGDLAYIYNLALISQKNGKNVKMLYQLQDEKDEFIGVDGWLGEEYASLPHENIASSDVHMAPSDVLFIPEIFTNVMEETHKSHLPCKRIVITQNYDFVVDQLPFSRQWGDYNIMESMVKTDVLGDMVKELFPYVKTTTVNPFIHNKFFKVNTPKKLVVNIIAKDDNDVNKIIKPFKLKYPIFKFVSFVRCNQMPQDVFAENLRNNFATIWVDRENYFGLSALEALKSGSIVIAKTTDITQEWMVNDDNDKTLSNCCLWFDTIHEVHKILANVVRAWMDDNVPCILEQSADKAVEKYTYDNTVNQMTSYLADINARRKKEFENIIILLKKKIDTNN